MTPEERAQFAAKDATDIETVRLGLLKQIEQAGADGIQAERATNIWWGLSSKHAPGDGMLRCGLSDLFAPVFLRGTLPRGNQDFFPAKDEEDIRVLLAACSEGAESFCARIKVARELREADQHARNGARRIPLVPTGPRVIPADQAEMIFFHDKK